MSQNQVEMLNTTKTKKNIILNLKGTCINICLKSIVFKRKTNYIIIVPYTQLFGSEIGTNIQLFGTNQIGKNKTKMILSINKVGSLSKKRRKIHDRDISKRQAEDST